MPRTQRRITQLGATGLDTDEGVDEVEGRGR
jgi:hypothetical protein